MEWLERRECLAATFGFEGGVLQITGDDERNVVEMFQPRDRVIEVAADGRRETFYDVDEVFVDALGGDDDVLFGKPKEIVVVGSKINVNAGTGNDLVHIDDGGATLEPVTWDTPMEFAIDLGTGVDALRADVQHHNELHLKVLSSDGGDSVAIGHTIGLRHEHTRPESMAQIDLHLAGGNVVDVRLENIENVDVSIVAETPPSEPVTGGTINVYWHAINRGSGYIGRNDGFIQMVSVSRPSGEDLSGTIGVGPTSLSFSATDGGDTSSSSGSIALDLGSDNDTVSILSNGVEDLQLDLDTGSGDDLVFVISRNDAAARPASLLVDLSLGGGSDAALLDILGYSEVALRVNTGPAGDGNDLFVASIMFSSTDHSRRIRRVADDRQDLIVLLVGAGYDVQIDTSGPNFISTMNYKY